MKFSVVIPTKDRPRFLAKAIDAALHQTCPDVEVIVVDGSANAAGAESMSGVLYIHAPGSTITQAVNIGLRASTGDVLHFACDDDVMLENALEVVEEQIGRSMWLYGRASFEDLAGVPIRVAGIEPFDLRCHLGRGNLIPQSATFWVREAMLQIGLFDEDPALDLASDYDYWCRLALRWPPKQIPALIARMTSHPGSITVSRSDDQAAHARVVRAKHARSLDQIGGPQ